MKIVDVLLRPLNKAIGRLEESYEGRLRSLPQSLILIGFFAVASAPFLVYVGLLALQLRPPYCYLSLALWLGFCLGFDGFIIACIVRREYAQTRRLIEGLSKEFKWDTNKYAEEYLELVENSKEGKIPQGRPATSRWVTYVHSDIDLDQIYEALVRVLKDHNVNCAINGSGKFTLRTSPPCTISLGRIARISYDDSHLDSQGSYSEFLADFRKSKYEYHAEEGLPSLAIEVSPRPERASDKMKGLVATFLREIGVSATDWATSEG
jgi:hypothetical protein